MADEEAPVVVPDGQTAWNTDDQEVEVIIDEDAPEENIPAEFKDLSKGDILKRLQEVESKAAQNTQLSEALTKLADPRVIVQPSPAPAPAPAPTKAPTLDEMREQYGEKFTMDPVGTVMELLQKDKMSPQVAQIATGNLQLARRIMELDPEKSPTFKKYANEIDGMVANAPPEIRTNPMIYEEAYKRVVANHMDDILSERVNAAVEKKLAEMKIATPEGAKTPPTFTEGRGLAQPAKRTTIRMSQAQLDRLRTLGIDPKDYASALGGAK